MAEEIQPLTDEQVVQAARAKLRDLAMHDLRFWMNTKLSKVRAGSPIHGGGSDYSDYRQHLRTLLADIDNSAPKPVQPNTGE